MTGYIFLVSRHVETVSLDEIKKMGDKTRISEVWFVLALVFVAEL